MAMRTDFYKTLGVEKTSTEDDIKKAYRKLAMLWHPDKHSQESEANKLKAEEKFKEINQAYEILGNHEKRNKYDLLGHGDEFSQTDGFQFNNPNDIFNSFFQTFNNQGNHPGQSNGGFNFNFDMFPNSMKQGQKIHINLGKSGGKPRQNNQTNASKENDQQYFKQIVKAEPVHVDLNVSLEELYHGVTKKMKISRNNKTGKISKTYKNNKNTYVCVNDLNTINNTYDTG